MLEVMSLMFETYPKVKQTLKDLNIGYRDVYSVKTTEIAYDAFAFMIKHNVSGLPVVTDAGELHSTISLTDFKVL
jgi:CBS-domain-containing membrane protein